MSCHPVPSRSRGPSCWGLSIHLQILQGLIEHLQLLCIVVAGDRYPIEGGECAWSIRLHSHHQDSGHWETLGALHCLRELLSPLPALYSMPGLRWNNFICYARFYYLCVQVVIIAIYIYRVGVLHVSTSMAVATRKAPSLA